MTIKDPTEEELQFYSQFKGFKVQKAGNYTMSLSINNSEVISALKLSAVQNKYIAFCQRARDKGGEMELTFSQFCTILSSCCVYCGGIGGSVDRIDSSLGYTVKNTQPVCGICNQMKYTHSHSGFLAHVNKIANNHRGKKKQRF